VKEKDRTRRGGMPKRKSNYCEEGAGGMGNEVPIK